MPRYTFYGQDDDVAFVETNDEFASLTETYDAYNGAQFHIVSTAGQLRVCLGDDDDTGCWNIALGPVSGANPVPAWPITLGAANGELSATITVDAPADARLIEVTA
ncbi:hypothetical protein [Nocardia acidivorans]|uniref:hypothetical protein n=1 Tax=Nocardia acidivorans TaxID=404580 RepID=UPI00082D575C|nr:hypothetical protein [Nocardia acidivorans]